MQYGLTIFNYDALEADELWGVIWGRYIYLDHSLNLSALGFESRAIAQLACWNLCTDRASLRTVNRWTRIAQRRLRLSRRNRYCQSCPSKLGSKLSVLDYRI